ncbi:MAG TPA: SIMPL domain-containing protein [Bryobacteraceae bacterium]|nr:SIMPL domain-containing protein [Bryobacteraceae bacterium]
MAVVGEAVRRVPPESAEFLVELTVTSGSVAQAIRDHTAKLQQLAVAAASIGIQANDLQTVSMNVYNLFSPAMPGLTAVGAYGAIPQIGPGAMNPFASAAPPGAHASGYGAQAGGYGGQAEVQFGSYQVRGLIRLVVRDPSRVGEVVQTAIRAGAIPVGPLTFRASDEAVARRAALEAAGADARTKAETLARSMGKAIGDAVVVTEDVVVSNGAYGALRAAMPGLFGSGAPAAIGELEYYARVSANFRFNDSGLQP